MKKFEEVIENYLGQNLATNEALAKACNKICIEFAQLHCQKMAEKIAEKAKFKYGDPGFNKDYETYSKIELLEAAEEYIKTIK